LRTNDVSSGTEGRVLQTYRNDVIVAWHKHHFADVFPSLHSTVRFLSLREVHDIDWLWGLNDSLAVVLHDVPQEPRRQRDIVVEDGAHVYANKHRVAQEGRHVKPGVSNCSLVRRALAE